MPKDGCWPGAGACGIFPFKKEAYRLPTFEALLNGPTDVPLDGPFDVTLLARYFAVTSTTLSWMNCPLKGRGAGGTSGTTSLLKFVIIRPFCPSP